MGSQRVFDDGDATDLLSEPLNYVGDVGVGPDDGAQFDATSVADADNDLTNFDNLDMQAGYTGIITQSAALCTLVAAMLLNGGALSKYVTDGNDLDIKGDFNSSGAGDGLIHNIGGVVRFGAGLHLDKGDVDSAIEYVDFVGGSLVAHDTFVSVGSTQLPAVFFVRSNNQMRIVAGSTVMNVTLETDASIIDNGSIETLSIRGNLIITDLVGSILSTLPGRFTLQFNALEAPGGDYGTANFQVTSSLINIQGDVVNVHTAKIARTFPTDAATLGMGLFNFSCEILEIGSLVNDAINGDILVPSGRRLVANISCSLGATDGVIPTVLEFADGALAPTLGSLIVGAQATLEFNNNTFVIPVPGDVTIDATASADFRLVTIKCIDDSRIDNSTSSNLFYILSVAFPGKTTIFGEVSRCSFLEFNGGTVDCIGDSIATGINQINKKVLTVNADTVFTDSSGGWLDIKARGTGAGVNTVDGVNLVGGDFHAHYGTGTIKLLGPITCAIFRIESGAADTNGQTVITSVQLNIAGPLALNGSLISTLGSFLFNNANSLLSGPGQINIGIDLNHSGAAVMDCTDISIIIDGDHLLSLGGTLDLKNGQISTLGDFVPLGQVNFDNGIYIVHGDIDLNLASGISANGATIISRGAADRVVKLAALTNYTLVMDNTAGGFPRIQQAFVCGTGFYKEIARGNGTIEHLDAGASSCQHIETVGVGGAKNSNISSGAGTYQITVVNVGPVNRYSGWADCNIVGAFIKVDTDTGSDDGGNDTTAPDGIDFGAFPADQVGIGRRRKIGGGNLEPNVAKEKTIP